MVRQPRLLTMIVLSCAIFLRVWVPAGWMPAANGGAFAIEPCAAAAPVPMVMHGEGSRHDGSHHKGAPKAQHDGDCVFSALQVVAAADFHAPVFVAPALAAATLPHDSPASYLATGPPAPLPPSTGPPALA